MTWAIDIMVKDPSELEDECQRAFAEGYSDADPREKEQFETALRQVDAIRTTLKTGDQSMSVFLRGHVEGLNVLDGQDEAAPSFISVMVQNHNH